MPAVLVLGVLWFSRYYTTVLARELRKLLPWLVALLIPVLCWVIPTVEARALGRPQPAVLATAGFSVGVVAAIGWLIWAYYGIDHT